MSRSSSSTENDVKVHLACSNVFLSLSLSFYLKGQLAKIEESDFVITDDQECSNFGSIPVCLVGKDLLVPCSVYEIFSQLHDFYNRVCARKTMSILQEDRSSVMRGKLPKDREIKVINDDIRAMLKGVDPVLASNIDDMLDKFSSRVLEIIKKNNAN